MTNSNCNILIVILGVLIVIAIIYYFNSNNNPIHNHGTLPNGNNLSNQQSTYDEISDNIVDDLVSEYQLSSPSRKQKNNDLFGASDPLASPYGLAGGSAKANKLKIEYDDDCDPRDFVYKKKKFTKRTPDDIKDLFDIDKMMPQETENNWFDIEPLQNTKKIKGTQFIHPKVHMGVDTVGGSLKNPSLDIRGDIPNPIMNVSPWNNSTIQPDTNLKGLCQRR